MRCCKARSARSCRSWLQRTASKLTALDAPITAEVGTVQPVFDQAKASLDAPAKDEQRPDRQCNRGNERRAPRTRSLRWPAQEVSRLRDPARGQDRRREVLA